jgi:hypothetical protein
MNDYFFYGVNFATPEKHIATSCLFIVETLQVGSLYIARYLKVFMTAMGETFLGIMRVSQRIFLTAALTAATCAATSACAGVFLLFGNFSK